MLAYARGLVTPERPRGFGARWLVLTEQDEYLTPELALQNSAVLRGVDFLASQIAQLPWMVYERKGRGVAEAVPDHPVSRLLNESPDPGFYSAFRWRHTLMMRAILGGNGLAEIVRNNLGEPIRLAPITGARAMIDATAEGLIYEMTGQDDAPGAVLTNHQVFHLPGFGDGPIGQPVIEYAGRTLGWARAVDMFGATYFASGGQILSALEVPTALSQEAGEAMQKDFETRYMGRRGRKLFIADKGMKLVRYDLKAADAQLTEAHEALILDIARFLGVPPPKLFDFSRATYNNIEHVSIAVVADSLMPWIVQLEQEANAKLLPASGGYFTSIDQDALMRGDVAARASYYKEMFAMAAISPNEIRAREGLNTTDHGDAFFIPANFRTVDAAIAGDAAGDVEGAGGTPPGAGAPAEPGEAGDPDHGTDRGGGDHAGPGDGGDGAPRP